MTSLTLVKQCGVGNFEWLQLGQGESTISVGDAERLAQSAIESQRCIFISPADGVTLKLVEYEEGESKLLSQTLPYFLEDDLIDDVENLHFSMGIPDAGKVPVAIVKRSVIEKWLAPFQEEDIDLRDMVAELFFVPLEKNCWSLFIENHRCLVRSAQFQGFSVPLGTATIALQLLVDQSEEYPERIVVYGATDNTQQDEVVAVLPDFLKNKVQWNSDDYWSMVKQSLAGEPREETAVGQQEVLAEDISAFSFVNFLQGRYVRNLPWKRWWKTWKIPSILLLSAVLVSIITAYTRVSVLEQTNIDLRREIEQTYRGVVPKGAVMDAERQLRRKVASLKGQSDESFILLLAKIGKVIAETNDLNLQNLNYTGKQSEVRVTVIAGKFEDVEKAREKLERLGLNAQLTGSSAEGNKTRARLRIRG